MNHDHEWVLGLEILRKMRPVRDFGGVRNITWTQIVSDIDKFLPQWGERCQDLGWTTIDLFGVNARAPYARLDHAGLLVLLSGRPVIEITEKLATISFGDDHFNRYYKRRPSVEQVALWELRQ